MLREIINFTRSLSPESFKRGLQPAQGLHVQITLNEKGELQKYEKAFFKDGDEPTLFLQSCLSRQINTKMVSINKALDSKKKIHSCSPFCIAFKSKTLNEVQERINDYFNTGIQYCENEKQRKWAEIFGKYCDKNLLNLLVREIQDAETGKSGDKKFKLSENHYIYVYLANVAIEDFAEAHQKYIQKKAFNKEEFNLAVEGQTFGVSDYLTGYNQKKPFLQHQSSSFDVSSRVNSDDSAWLFKFSQLRENKQLPNPLPIFIDKEELNDAAVKIFHEEETKKIGYSEIIRTVYEKEKDLGNYYLLYMRGKDEVKDFDFVSSFQFKVEPAISIENLYSVESDLTSQKIDDVFEFEKKIVNRIFDGQLVRKRDEGWWLRYFDDIENKPQYIRAAMYQLVLKYRKAFYDYIYKSKREAITSRMFHDIMLSGILDDLRQDEYKDKKHTKNFAIKEKLNIWFSLFDYFDQNRQLTGDQNMPSQILQLQARMQKIVSNNDAHLETDQEFAYATGQAIYYLLSCSEASNKSHALLEPFLQKTDTEQFKLAIARIFAQYKHAISFYKGKFEKLMAEILSYAPETELRSLLPMILAGYFAESIIYQKRDSAQTEAQ